MRHCAGLPVWGVRLEYYSAYMTTRVLMGSVVVF